LGPTYLHLDKMEIEQHRREKSMISSLTPATESELLDQTTVCLISSNWYNAWEIYCENGETRPGKIDNSGLQITTSKDEPRIRYGLVERIDYVIV
jgi:hypothetical protein